MSSSINTNLEPLRSSTLFFLSHLPSTLQAVLSSPQPVQSALHSLDLQSKPPALKAFILLSFATFWTSLTLTLLLPLPILSAAYYLFTPELHRYAGAPGPTTAPGPTAAPWNRPNIKQEYRTRDYDEVEELEAKYPRTPSPCMDSVSSTTPPLTPNLSRQYYYHATPLTPDTPCPPPNYSWCMRDGGRVRPQPWDMAPEPWGVDSVMQEMQMERRERARRDYAEERLRLWRNQVRLVREGNPDAWMGDVGVGREVPRRSGRVVCW